MKTTGLKKVAFSLFISMLVIVSMSGAARAANVTNVRAGAWFGTVSCPANGVAFSATANDGLNGGTPAVVATTPNPDVTMANGNISAYSVPTSGNKTFTVTPATGWRTKHIYYGTATLAAGNYTVASWTQITGASLVPTGTSTFNINIANASGTAAAPKNYIIWACFELITYSVVYSIVDDTPADSALSHCSATASISLSYSGVKTAYPSTITDQVGENDHGHIHIFNTNADCEIAGVSFEGGNYSTTNLSGLTSGSSYQTPSITAAIGNATVEILFKHIGYTITVTKTDTTPSCGSISPVQTAFEAGESQLFTIIKNSGCAIDSVLVDGTDVTASVTLVTNPTGVNTYYFSSIHANHTFAVTFIKVSTSLGAQYCQRPPFMLEQATLKPNVLMILDNSGSMGGTGTGMGLAYRVAGKSYGCSYTGVNSTIGSGTCKSYYGYFEPSTMYTASGSTYTINTAWVNPLGGTLPNLADTTDTHAGKGLSGNYLNYYNTQKIDVLRKILVGGRVDDTITVGGVLGAARGTTGTKYYLSQNDGKIVEYGTTEPIGIVHSLYEKVRFGIMNFNGNSSEIGSGDGGYISARLGSPLATLVNTIEGPDTDPSTYTPLGESLYEAIRYYQAGSSAFNSGVSYSTQNTVDGSGNCTAWNGCPTTDSPPEKNQIIQYSCQKHFVMLITDGEPTCDENIPGNPDKAETATDSNFSLNTWWNKLATADKPTGADAACSGTKKYWLPAVAYYAHNTDLKNPSVVKTKLTGIQNNLSVYTVYAFGTGAGTAALQAAAKYGAYLDTITENAIPDTGEYVNGYYAATDGAVLEQKLKEAFANIMDSAGSGTAAAVANNKSGERGANMLQALFYPQWPNDTTKKWMGEVQALWYYLDPIIGYSGIYEDSNSDNILDLTVDTIPGTNPFLTKALWRAGAELHKRTTTRNIYTLLAADKNLTLVGNSFDSTNLALLRTPMNLGVSGVGTGLTDPQATVLINYIRGTDATNYRSRKVTFTDPGTLVTTTDKEWKLGDIINSTPQVQSAVAINAYNTAYSDSSYTAFITSTAYKSRNVVYTGSNDGMFHAFKLGTVTGLSDASNPFRIATMTGTERGKEEWAFIPSNALPYIQNQAGTEYCHQCLVDGAPIVTDVAINNHCSAANYWECEKTISSWKTVVVSSMGLGGANRDMGTIATPGYCNETYSPNLIASDNKDCVKTPVTGSGLSSYFAMDVSDPLSPQFMWEFSDAQIPTSNKAYRNNGVSAPGFYGDAKGLGFTTSGAAIIRINSVNSSGVVQKKTNGRWFAVMASGPTGAITATQTFTGHSDQNLKIYIVDLNGGSTFRQCITVNASNCNYWVMDTGIPFAFANSLNGAAIDLDRSNSTKDGYYSDDVVYITYTKASLTHNAANPAGDFPINDTAWNKGGIIRLVTNHNPDPFTWFTSSLIDNIGPITTSIGRIQDKPNKKLWVYFGEGRSFFPGDETNIRRRFYGVADPCYTQYGDAIDSALKNADNSDPNFALGKTVATCPSVTGPAITDSYTADVTCDLQRQDTPSATLPSGKKGWYVNMAPTTGTAGAERVVSDVTANLNGTVFFTTYIPNTDACTPGGNTSVWAVKYNTGGTPSADSMQGKAPVQTSSGGIKLIDLATSFTEPGSSGRKLLSGLSPAGMAPKGRFPPLLQPRAIKQILNIQEQ